MAPLLCLPTSHSPTSVPVLRNQGAPRGCYRAGRPGEGPQETVHQPRTAPGCPPLQCLTSSGVLGQSPRPRAPRAEHPQDLVWLSEGSKASKAARWHLLSASQSSSHIGTGHSWVPPGRWHLVACQHGSWNGLRMAT